MNRGVLTVALLATGCGRIGFDLARSDGAPGPDAATPGPDAAAACGPALGLVGAWPMEAADVAGTVVRDRSGHGRDGTLRGMVGQPLPTLGPGRVGTALDFADAPFAYVDTPGVAFDPTPGAFTTIAFWMRNDDPSVDQGVVCLPPSPTPAPPRYCVWLTTSGGPPSLCINGGTSECWGVTDPGLIGRWVHVAAVFANGPETDGQLYVDGDAATMGCQFGACDQVRTAQPPFEIGNSDRNYAWRGQLDDVRAYDRALTAPEISALHACAP